MPTAPTMSARAERRAMIAVVAVFALLVQALIPSLAAASASPFGQVEICTAFGHQKAPDTGAEAQHACKHCLCPAPVNAPPRTFAVQPVRYLVFAEDFVRLPERRNPPARAPPRPPGQGPPIQSA